ncbi:MAG TPA: glutathione-dependent disulfide-bond oxidoreductase, partial [Parvularcula sp.]|nr:glutathione-dependent disulfide-bond oxidoreductase [Parvularcula sp.]
AGEEYTIADMAIWPWYGVLAQGKIYNDAGTFLAVEEYRHLQRWTADVAARPAVIRGRIVNRSWGAANELLAERHDAADIDRVLALPA